MSKRYKSVTALAARLGTNRQMVHLRLRALTLNAGLVPQWEIDKLGRRYWTEEAVVEWEEGQKLAKAQKKEGESDGTI